MGSLFISLALTVTTQTAPIDAQRASAYFKEFESLSSLEGGKLWGKPFYGALLFVDPATKTVVANQADAGHVLTQQGDVFVGKLPDDTSIANTTFKWSGTEWAMVMWPAPQSYTDRMLMMVHESFHRLQPSLGFNVQEEPCGHLEGLQGRYWMQLEWRALAKALRTPDASRDGFIRDALLFRKMRYQDSPDAERKEEELERLEGMAEYSGVKLRGTSDAESRDYQAKRLEEAVLHTPNMTRGFAYMTGPAYGLLLDEAGANWRADATKPVNFMDRLAQAAHIDLSDGKAEVEAKKYDAGPVMQAEQAREAEFKKLSAAYEKLLVSGPVLELPMVGWHVSFNPQKVVQLGNHGTVYPVLTLIADWGTLTVDKAALIGPSWSKTFVPLPVKSSDSQLSGDGWKIVLKPGWKTMDGDRKGDLRLVKA